MAACFLPGEQSKRARWKWLYLLWFVLRSYMFPYGRKGSLLFTWQGERSGLIPGDGNHLRYGLNVCPSKFLCWSSNHQRDGILRWDLWEVIRFLWRQDSRSHDGIGILRRRRETRVSPPREKVAVCKPKRGLSPETESSWQLDPGFPSFQSCKRQMSVCKPPCLRCFVIETWAD